MINDVHLAGSKKGKRSGGTMRRKQVKDLLLPLGERRKKPLVKLNGNVA